MTTVEPVWTERETRPVGWWGMLLAVATEATLFATLIASYLYLRFKTTPWPPEGIPRPDVVLPCILSAVLGATSLPMLLAGRARRSGNAGRARAAVLAALLLTAAFLGLQFVQWHGDWGRVRPREDAYASLYYTLPGLLWAHAAAGALLLLFVAYRLARRDDAPKHGAALQVASLYVHFVSAAALAVLVVVYLSPRL